MTEQLTRHQQSDGLALPPIQEASTNETPASAQEFFNRSNVAKQHLVTPVEPSTGVPLPIYPNKDLPPVVYPGQKNVDRLGDWHHPFHPRSAFVHGSLGLQALRSCRVQWTRYDDHHDGIGYHQTYAGPELPQYEPQIFKAVVFASAGFIGRHALKFAEDGEASIVELSKADSRRLLAPGVFWIDDYVKVAGFLLDYGARYSISAMDPDVVDELLHSNDLSSKIKIATDLIGCVSEDVTGQFKDEFRRAKLSRQLPPTRTSSAANYMRNLLTVQRDGSRSADKLTMRLLTEALHVT